jgi:hypothetical protein
MWKLCEAVCKNRAANFIHSNRAAFTVDDDRVASGTSSSLASVHDEGADNSRGQQSAQHKRTHDEHSTPLFLTVGVRALTQPTRLGGDGIGVQSSTLPTACT